MDDDTRQAQARARVESKIDLYKHIVLYAVVNTVLVVINLTSSPEHLWFPWPLLGWGIGLAAHASKVLGTPWGGPIRERMIEKELRKDRGDAPGRTDG